MLIDSCDWNAPGRDAYQGTARAAIEAMATIPAPIRAVLIERAERHDFDDVILVDRDSIKGKYDYEKEIGFMAFGHAGRVCVNVTRAGWDAARVESAMVFCEADHCVARFSVCNNWSIVARRRGDVGTDSPGERSLADASGGSITFSAAATAAMFAGPPGPNLSPGLTASTDALGWAGATSSIYIGSTWNSTTYIASPCCALCEVPGSVPAVPEVQAYALILAGLGAVAWRTRRQS